MRDVAKHSIVGGQGAPLGRVDVIVVTYRSASYVRDCLESLDRALEAVPGARIIVVDNGSGDDLAAVVSGISDRLTLIQREVNDGFAAGCHAGADASTAEHLLFFNPDATMGRDSVRILLAEAAEHPEAGIVGGRSVFPDGTTDHQSWMGRPTLWSALCFATGASSAFPGSRSLDPESSLRWDGQSRTVPVVSGGMMLVERQLWDQLGGFDRSFFLYGEDTDFCVRASAQGWSPRVAGGATYAHAVGASSLGSNRLIPVLRGRVTNYRRNLAKPWGAVAGGLLVVGVGLRARAARFRSAGGRRAHASHQWRDGWRRRDEWRKGW